MARNNGVLKDDSDLFDNKYGKLYCYDLPIAVLGNNYIKGKKYNHKEYLVDFINHSRLVKDKGGIFKHQKSQSDSECDAINNIGYGIDFKRFSGSNLMEAKVITSEDVYEMNGLIAYAVSEHNKKKYDYYDMFESIQMNPSLLTSKINTKDKKLLEDIELVKKLLSTKKNLMIFLPYEFEFYQVDADEVVAKQIVSLLYETLNTMGEFRNSQVNDLDLYFIFKSKKYMVIIDANDDIRLYDMVACECSELFSELLHIAWLDCCERIPCL